MISEKEQLALLPDACLRVLVAAEPEIIKERFSRRMHGNMPASVAAMLERKYGQFECLPHDLRIDTAIINAEEAATQIISLPELKWRTL